MNTNFHPKSQLLPEFPVETIGGMTIAALDRQETARVMIDAVKAARSISAPPLLFSSSNGQIISQVSGASDRTPSELMKTVDLISADGQSLVFASRLFGRGGIRERCATTDLFHDVARIACDEEVTFYILGATQEENELAVRNVHQLYPQLKIVGSHHGYFSGQDDEEETIQEINGLKPDIVWIGMGFPRQLEFCARWRDSLRNVGAIKTCGGLLNFLSQSRSRAPRWMQSAGLEWCYRLALEPRRLLYRYFITNIHATWLLISRTSR
ncbi:WecB/TagA/CpsF family glycosyltransferase [Aliiroseovarius sp. KMU-50]|uniref:WecB/TagA/CpsF family glycosyltransferase n=1 Tax=Aliiroseovarius salicola TaxID=3009082 RepID=A0ABT4W2C9_9RHOB|nr:WecB/TagA/CpsF family glycosyltransferase [Aliiroseovarius sp. KMU-50]MDA5094657.1 WecB/TagA/CpsF family glycosyltransferase [Aliiroseovarius sp. KMU-50]